MNSNKLIWFYFLFNFFVDALNGFFQCNYSMGIVLWGENTFRTDIGCVTVETIIQSYLIVNFAGVFLNILFFLWWFWFRRFNSLLFLLIFSGVPFGGRLKMRNRLLIKLSLHQAYLTHKRISSSIQGVDLGRTTNT